MSWPSSTLGAVCEVVSGATPKTGNPDFWDGEIPWVTPKDLSALKQKYLSDTPRKITDAGLKSCSAKMLPARSEDEANQQWKKCRPEFGDILYSKGGTTGIAARVTTSKPFAIWVHVALLRPVVEKVHPAWMEAMLNSAYCYAQSQRHTLFAALQSRAFNGEL